MVGLRGHHHQNSRLDRMFMARLHRRALAFLGFWVRRLLSQRGESAPRDRRAWQTESRRSKAVIARDGSRVFAECPRQAMAWPSSDPKMPRWLSSAGAISFNARPHR
jgi:hypothetical protein